MKNPIFQQAVATTFRIGRSRVEYGKIVATGDVDDLVAKVKNVGLKGIVKYTPQAMQNIVSKANVEGIKQSLSAIPAGDAFSDLEDKVNSAEDVTVLLITKKVILEILAKLATKRRVGGFGQALKKTALDISRAAGVDV